MRIPGYCLLAVLVALLTLLAPSFSAAQDMSTVATGANVSSLIVGHPFTAIKYARRVRVLADGKSQFVRNVRYPTPIARDANGRLMMQDLNLESVATECLWLDAPIPPVCPNREVFVVDPVANTWTHWVEGDSAHRAAIKFPLTPERLKEAVTSTTLLPALEPSFTDQDGKIRTVDLGDREIETIPAHGFRWTLLFDDNQDGHTVRRTRIREVWTSAAMQLILRVIDGDPNGEETVWGVERMSAVPDASLFQPPNGYQLQDHCMDRRMSPQCDGLTQSDFEILHQWFAE